MSKATVRIATALVALFILLYAVYQAYRYFSSDYVTEMVFEVDAPRFCDTTGLLIRDEEEIEKTINGVVHYAVEEGGRFRDTTVIARVFSSEEEARTADLAEKAQAELNVLEKVLASEQTADIAALSGRISAGVLAFSDLCAKGEYDHLEDARLEILLQMGQKAMISGEEAALEQRMEELRAQAASGAGAPVYAADTGYFSRYVDGYEARITPQLLSDMDVASLRELLASEYPYDTDAFGKSVKSQNWYYVTAVSREDGEKFIEGRTVTLTFFGGSSQRVSAVVNRVIEGEEGEETLLILKSDNVTSDTVSLRKARVRISLSDYTGLRFSRQALRIVDGKKGVYVKSGYQIVFKEVEIIYQGKDYYLSRMEQNSATHLNLFEEVIVEGRDLYDGKPVDPKI